MAKPLEIKQWANKLRNKALRIERKIAKMTPEQQNALEHQDEIGKRYSEGEAVSALAREFKVTPATIRRYCMIRGARRKDKFGGDSKQDLNCAIECEGKDQSYRESLRWAIDAAGAFHRTGVEPTSCPCDTAWYLYRQAINEPKDFLQKVGQIESKGDGEGDDRKNIRRSGERSIAEIDSMLEELNAQSNS